MNKYPLIWISIVCVVLLVLGSFPATPGFYVRDQKPLSKHIITVDDEPGVADYTSIKEALNHSSPGDIIEVFSGTYYEHGIIITEKGISLIGMPYELGNGSDTGKPFINGKGLGDIIRIKTQNVSVTGFRMENRGAGYCIIIGIGWGANGCVLSNNTLRYAGNSIIGCDSNFSRIINNTISDAGSRYGIEIGYNYNTISGNIINNCPTGICFWGGINNTIVGNRISNSSEFGVDIGGGGLNTFQYNTFENNILGLHIYQSVLNRIKQNNFIHNTYQAGYNLGLSLMAGNRFFRNYWDRPRLLPYPIKGSVLLIVPWVSFDWRPALKPYIIS